MIVLVSLIVLLRGLPCFHDFLHGASHPYILIHSMIFALIFDDSRKSSYAHAYMRTLHFNHVLMALK